MYSTFLILDCLEILINNKDNNNEYIILLEIGQLLYLFECDIKMMMVKMNGMENKNKTKNKPNLTSSFINLREDNNKLND